MEVMICHRDGYSFARNNFRIYHDLDTDRIIFLPAGMDQLFGKADLPWKPYLSGIVAKAVMETPEGKQHYQEHFQSLFTNVFKVEALDSRADQVVLGLRPFLGNKEFKAVEEAVTELKKRIAQRRNWLSAELSQPEPVLMEFKDGVALLSGWKAVDAPSGTLMEKTKSPDGILTLHIPADPKSLGSWRMKVLLKRGHYRFEGRGKVAGVEPLPYGKHQGAGLRVSGRARQTDDLTGDSPWRQLAAEFQVDAPTEEVELICELRATAGEAWFDADSLRLVQVR
jgi:hypothetical protein